MPLPPNYDSKDVIRIILDVAGIYTIPTDLEGIVKKKLVSNLDYTDILMGILQIELDKFVKKFNATLAVTDDDLKDCQTVQDVIDVVEKIIK